MDIFTQQIINGLVLGSIYALVALGRRATPQRLEWDQAKPYDET